MITKKIDNYQDLKDSKLNLFVDFESYERFALENHQVNTNIGEFINNDNRIKFSDVLDLIKHWDIQKFHIVWGLMCRPINNEFKLVGCNYVSANKQELLSILSYQDEENQPEIQEGGYKYYITDSEYVFDLIICDDSFSWCFSLVHDEDKFGNRIVRYSKI